MKIPGLYTSMKSAENVLLFKDKNLMHLTQKKLADVTEVAYLFSVREGNVTLV